MPEARHSRSAAIPPTLAGRITYQSALPGTRDGLTQQMPMGCLIKVQVAYPAPFWRAAGLSGFGISLDDALSVTLDNCPLDASCGILVGFFEGAHARSAARMTPQQRRASAVATLVKLFRPDANEPVDYLEQTGWRRNTPEARYGGRLGAGVWTQYGAALAGTCGRIHWAGAETSDTWNGYMDSAVRSGHRAAAEVLSQID